MPFRPRVRWRLRVEDFALIVPVGMSDDAGPGEGAGVSGQVAVLPSAVGEMVAAHDVGPPRHDLVQGFFRR
jgi:hypothetical protein